MTCSRDNSLQSVDGGTSYCLRFVDCLWVVWLCMSTAAPAPAPATVSPGCLGNSHSRVNNKRNNLSCIQCDFPRQLKNPDAGATPADSSQLISWQMNFTGSQHKQCPLVQQLLELCPSLTAPAPAPPAIKWRAPRHAIQLLLPHATHGTCQGQSLSI
ncbi:hypothetical protein ACLKA7_000341 [Drosophila subpalustris]